MPDLFRRRLLQAAALAPLMTSNALFAQAPSAGRVVALEWLPVELLLALGITPLAAADTTSYRQWVQTPALPADIIDVGLRTEPNMELLTQLQPSLILYSQGYGPSPERLARIAPGMGFSFNDGSGKPLTNARHSLTQLADRLAMPERAAHHLQAFDSFIASMRQRFAARPQPRPVLLMSMLDSRHAIAFGKNSLFLETMELLGLQNAWQGETNFWGSAVIGLERLADIGDAEVICFDHGNEPMMQQITSGALWRSLQFVRQEHFQRVPPVWYYGATLSAMQLCHVLDRALEPA